MLKIIIKQGDITKEEVDAIVNPANSYGYMGGGVAGAIKNAGGIEIERQAIAQAPIPIGNSIITTAGKLKAKYVIHSPTMEKPAQITDLKRIKNTTLAALNVADKNKLGKIAMPGMSTGVGGIPKDKAAKAMIEVIKNFNAKSLKEVILVAYNEDLKQEFEKALNVD